MNTQNKIFSCDKCKKCFVFKSTYRIHHWTHLQIKMHECFTGSCGQEYKWPQDMHRHLQIHLKRSYGCSVCDYTNPQKYLLKRHLCKHEYTMYYNCDNREFECKYYTQLSCHVAKCPKKGT